MDDFTFLKALPTFLLLFFLVMVKLLLLDGVTVEVVLVVVVVLVLTIEPSSSSVPPAAARSSKLERNELRFCNSFVKDLSSSSAVQPPPPSSEVDSWWWLCLPRNLPATANNGLSASLPLISWLIFQLNDTTESSPPPHPWCSCTIVFGLAYFVLFLCWVRDVWMNTRRR